MRITKLAALLPALWACGEVEVLGPPADPCETEVCECTSATEDSDCGAHEFCDTTSGPGRTCECVAGYAAGVNGCAFTGTIQDPGFQQATVWTVANGALLNPTAVGSVESGEASFLPSTLCALGFVEQTVEMPTFAKAEPLVLDLTYKNQVDFGFGDRVLTGVSFGGVGWTPLPSFFDAVFHTTRLCIPEGAYAPGATPGKGAPVNFRVGPYLPPTACPNSNISNFAIDHFAIVPALPGECNVIVGEGINFDAEADSGGWTATGAGALSFVNGLGVGGSRAAVLTVANRCDTGNLETTFNVPNIENPALEFFVGTSAPLPGVEHSVTMAFGTFQFTPPPAGVSRSVKMCIPPTLRGQTANLSFRITSSGLCSGVINAQIFADEVRVVDDPTCGSTPSLTNTGFEQGTAPLGTFGTSGTATAAAVVRSVGGNAHTGDHYLSLEMNGRCVKSGYRMLPVVPPAKGADGPALTFFANVGVNPNTTTTATALGLPTVVTLNEGGGYQKYVVCLDRTFVGRHQQVLINHDGGGGLCDNSNFVMQEALIDDIEVTTDPSCVIP